MTKALCGKQLSIFTVLDAYGEGDQSNDEAYERLGSVCGIDPQQWQSHEAIGRSQRRHSTLKRRVRWYQQSLKRLGWLEPVAGRRGHWRATEEGRKTKREREQLLEPSAAGIVQLGFSTELGIALWADCRDVFSRIDEPVHLVLTSPPYALARPRDYGNPGRDEYVDWLCSCLEPVVARLVPGGSLFLNVSNDIFEAGSPARSLYRERLVIALHERLGLHKMDEWIWHNPTKAPGPIQWASKERVQLNVAWEPIYWFTNDPRACFADNRRVLRAHTARHTQYIANGGSGSAAVFGDGANRRRTGAFGTPTAGAIPRNVLTVPHRCPSQTALRAWCKSQGIPVHSATMPLALAEHVVRFASSPGQLVADPFGGWGTTAVAAELNARRWIISERMRAHLFASRWRMHAMEG